MSSTSASNTSNGAISKSASDSVVSKKDEEEVQSKEVEQEPPQKEPASDPFVKPDNAKNTSTPTTPDKSEELSNHSSSLPNGSPKSLTNEPTQKNTLNTSDPPIAKKSTTKKKTAPEKDKDKDKEKPSTEKKKKKSDKPTASPKTTTTTTNDDASNETSKESTKDASPVVTADKATSDPAPSNLNEGNSSLSSICNEDGGSISTDLKDPSSQNSQSSDTRLSDSSANTNTHAGPASKDVTVSATSSTTGSTSSLNKFAIEAVLSNEPKADSSSVPTAIDTQKQPSIQTQPPPVPPNVGSKNGNPFSFPTLDPHMWPPYHASMLASKPNNDAKQLKRHSSSDHESPETKRLKSPPHSAPNHHSKVNNPYNPYLDNGIGPPSSSPSASSSLSSLSQLSQSIGGTINNQKERETALAAANVSKNASPVKPKDAISAKWNNQYAPMAMNPSSSASVQPARSITPGSSASRPPLPLFPPPIPSSLAGSVPLDPLSQSNADLLRRELDNRFLASQDRNMKIPPPPYMRNDLSSLYGLPFSHMASNLQFYEKYAKMGSFPPLPGMSPIPPVPPPSLEHLSTSPPSGQSTSAAPERAYSSNAVAGQPAAFQPKNSNSQFSDTFKGSGKKSGRWCAMHVRIAWEIYQRQQKQSQQDKLIPSAPLVPSNNKLSSERSTHHDKERNRDSSKCKETNGSPSTNSSSHNSKDQNNTPNNDSVKPMQTLYPGLRPHEMPSFSASLLSAAAGHMPPSAPGTPNNPFMDPLSHSNLLGMSSYRPPLPPGIPSYPPLGPHSPGLLGLSGFPPSLYGGMPYGADPWRTAGLPHRPPLPPPPLSSPVGGSPSTSPWGGLAKNGDGSVRLPPPPPGSNLSEADKRELARRMDPKLGPTPNYPTTSLSAASMRDLAMFQILH